MIQNSQGSCSERTTSATSNLAHQIPHHLLPVVSIQVDKGFPVQHQGKVRHCWLRRLEHLLSQGNNCCKMLLERGGMEVEGRFQQILSVQSIPHFVPCETFNQLLFVLDFMEQECDKDVLWFMIFTLPHTLHSLDPTISYRLVHGSRHLDGIQDDAFNILPCLLLPFPRRERSGSLSTWRSQVQIVTQLLNDRTRFS